MRVTAFREAAMKRNSRMQNKFVQFSYDHKKLNAQMKKIKESAGELNRLLDQMGPQEKKEEEK